MPNESSRKRNKPSYVCLNCRRKKIRCNRQLPCSSCVKINAGYTCSYDTKWKPVKTGGTERPLNHKASSNIVFNNESPLETGTSSMENTISPFLPQPSTLADENRILKNRVIELERLLHDVSENGGGVVSDNSSTSSSTVMHKPYIRTTPILPPNKPTSPNPEVDDDDVLNFYDGYSLIRVKGHVRRVNSGPLSPVALYKRDPVLAMVWNAISSKGYIKIIDVQTPNRVSGMCHSLPVYSISNTVISDRMDRLFKKKFLEVEGYDEVTSYKSRIEKDMAENLEESEVNDKGLNDNSSNKMVSANAHNSDDAGRNEPAPRKLTYTQISLARTLFEGKVNPELHLIEKVKQLLPKKKVLWSLVDIFFSKLYLSIPFIDESEFRKDLQKIFGPANYKDEPFTRVIIGKKMELATIATCFIMMRLTYLSLYSNRDCINLKEMKSTGDSIKKYIFENPVTSSFVEVANSCLYCFDVTRRSNLTIFQACLMMRIYKYCAPEECDGIDGGGSQIGTAILIQMAYSLGLNREPDKLDVCNDDKINNIGRKIWYFLLRLDMMYCASVGNPINIYPHHYDVNLPFVTKYNSNTIDVAIDAAAVSNIVYLHNQSKMMRNLAGYASDINRGVKMNTITRDLHEFELNLENQYKALQESVDFQEWQDTCTSNIDTLSFTLQFQLVLGLRTALLSFYHHIYLHYEKKLDSELAFFYLCKLMYIIIYNLMPCTGDVLYGSMSSRSLFINPVIQFALSKVTGIIMSCLVRVSYNVRVMEQKPSHSTNLATNSEYKQHYQSLRCILKALNREANLLCSLSERMGSRYYYSWRISKAHTVLFGRIAKPEFYDKYASSLKKIKAFQFTPAQLDLFQRLISLLVATTTKVVNYEDAEDNPVPDFSPMENPTDESSQQNNEANEFQENNNGSSQGLMNTNSIDSISFSPLDSFGEGGASSSLIPGIPHSTKDEIDQMWLQLSAMHNDPDQDGLESWLPSIPFPFYNNNNTSSQGNGGLFYNNSSMNNGNGGNNNNKDNNGNFQNGSSISLQQQQQQQQTGDQEPQAPYLNFRDPLSSVYIDPNFDLSCRYNYDQLL
ncbi:CTA4 [Candida oxycetoniae]|uniref:CTA4 n=1 Tax=Candida oxycetoniae TaxID=497107 RepID=A0AAI9WZT7_9ASCO|nr:CTA4 [Candida oxycetoniae]KAI3406235.2 CTA4 [Candida oxycetoniae]